MVFLICYSYFMNASNTDTTGLYQHYKGNEYEVMGEGIHTETKEKFVVYRDVKAPRTIWVRPYEMFFSTVTTASGEKPRFSKIKHHI
jgi:hypothetical protein